MAISDIYFVFFIFCSEFYLSIPVYVFNPTKDVKLTKEQISAPKTDLWVVGTFLSAHKYFGVDSRYVTGDPKPDDQVFYKEFPRPALRELNAEVVKECELGVTQCVTSLYQKAIKSNSLRQIFGKRGKPYSPFDSYYELFSYRTTASYYMCWYTMMEEEYLKYPSGTVARSQGCLDFLNAVDEVPKDRKRKLRSGEQIIEDYRSKLTRLSDPFACAKLWFCPDPCYGRKNRGNVKGKEKDRGNPCKRVKIDDTCGWKSGANLDFQSLIKNRFNITCECDKQRKGFNWNSPFGICVDKDECFDGVADCPTSRVCKNTVGSFMCTCPRGYAPNPVTDVCERTALIHLNAKILKYNPDVNKPKETGFLSDAMDFVGLSGTVTFSCNQNIVVILLSLILSSGHFK